MVLHPTSVTRLGNFCTLGNHSKLVATTILHKLPTLLGNFCKGCQNYSFSSEIIFGELLLTFGDFFWSQCTPPLPSLTPRLLQEMTSRWRHRSVSSFNNGCLWLMWWHCSTYTQATVLINTCSIFHHCCPILWTNTWQNLIWFFLHEPFCNLQQKLKSVVVVLSKLQRWVHALLWNNLIGCCKSPDYIKPIRVRYFRVVTRLWHRLGFCFKIFPISWILELPLQ